MNPTLERYLDDAVRFQPREGHHVSARPLRVAQTLLTCEVAVAILNDLCMPAEGQWSYRHVNVHNPRCPLYFDVDAGHWTCLPHLNRYPAWGINWSGALLMCRHLGARLPHASEWEAVASNNDPGRPYPWGEAPPNHLLANYDEHVGAPCEVGLFPATEHGLYDLAGNLGEWCHDPYEPPGAGLLANERVVKGGAWSKGPEHLRIAANRGKWQRLGTTTIGVRPVWDD